MSIECNELGNVVISRGHIIAKRWAVMSKLGEGGCGTVYKVVDLTCSEKLAMKAEANCIEGGSVLKLEAKILNKLNGKPHFPHMKHSGKREKFSYIIMTLLGDPLSYLCRLHGSRTNSVSTQVRLGINILHAVKTLHDCGVVHRDIKPANLAMGHQDSANSHIVHVLDFGLAREFVIEENGKKCMRRAREDCLFRGTSRYCSVNTHEKGDQGRVDDMWSVVFMIAEMRTPLPWAKLREKAIVLESKKATCDQMLLYNSPIKMVKIAEHLRTLGFYDRPDYRYIYDVLMDVMRDQKINFDDLYDWEEVKDDKTGNVKGSRSRQASAEVIKKEKVSTSPSSSEQMRTAEEVNSSETQEDPETWGDFPAEDFNTNPLGF